MPHGSTPAPHLPFPQGNLWSQPSGLGSLTLQLVRPFRENSPLELSLSPLAWRPLALSGWPDTAGHPGLPAQHCQHPTPSHPECSQADGIPHISRRFLHFGPDRCWSLFLECLIFPRDALLPSPTSFPGREGPPLCASIAPLYASSHQMLTILRAAVLSESSLCPEPGT